MNTHLKEDIIHKYVIEKKSCKTIGKELNVSHSYVYEHLKEWNIELRKSKNKKERICDKYKSEIIDMYLNKKLSVLEIADNLNISIYTIYDGLKEWGVKRRSPSENSKFKANYKFFDKIDNENKAYWLGFMYADGYITNDYMGLTLSSKDKTHLEKYRRDLNSNHNINEYFREGNSKTFNKKDIYYSRLLLKSKNLTNSLKDKGCLNNKSLILKFPNENILPQKYARHFLRGYFDGDGSLILSHNSINFKLCGTKEFLSSVIDILNKNIPTHTFNKKFYKRRKDDKNNYYISYGGRIKTLSVMDFIYKDSNIFLDRKYELYLKLKSN